MEFRILDQQIEQIENQEIIIHLSGLTQDNKSVYCKVLGYQPYCFLELPVHINWTSSKIDALAEYIKNKLKECPPDVMKFEVKKLAMYSVTRPILKILFKTEDTIKHLKNTLRYKWKIEGFNKEFEANDFKLHEQNIPTLIKFGMERKIDMAGWITVKPIEMEPSNYSECDYSIYTLAKNVKKSSISSDVLVDPLICSFDIELHSMNRKSSTPAPDLPENVITMISLTFGRLSQNLDDWDTYVITLYKGDREPDGKYKSTVIDCTGSEKRLLVNFTKLVKRMKPDIITGYNINGFDWGALLKRAQLHQVTHRFLKMGKLKYELDKVNDQSWSSGARGKQEILYIKLNGVFNFDMYPEIRFNHNLPMYKLGFVAEKFLGTGESKDDMPYQQMFALFDMIEILERSLESVDDQLDVVVAKKLIFSKVSKEELLIVPGMTNHVADLYNDLKQAHELEQVVGICREYMLKLLKYVIQDAKICPALMKFLNSLTSLWENANISKCPPNFVYEKGQQIKVLAQYLEQAHWRNYVIPFYNKPKVEEEDSEDDDKKNYQGATVLKVKKGLYKNIAILDFKSLYPSIMIANNICHSTFRPNEDTRVKDEECNIAKWSEHIRCEHDPEKRKKKKGEKAYCGDHKYRFIKHDGDENKKGLLPLLLEHLLNYREQVKKEMAVYDKKWKSLKEIKIRTGLSDEQEKELVMAQRISNVLDSRQLAIKVSSNSCYGFLGALTGYFPLVAGAASVTYYGREYISKAISITETNFKGAEVIYGDSVVGNTPLLLQRDGIIEIKTIETLGDEWKSYDQFKAGQSNRKEKQQSVTDYKVWTENGWSQIKRVIRHKCKKDIWRVNSRFGSVDVTEDHSLLNSDGEKIKPGDLVVDETILLSSFPEDIDTVDVLVPEYKSGKEIDVEFYECTKCFEEYDGSMYYCSKGKRQKQCKLCIKKKQCETKGIAFNGRLNRELLNINVDSYVVTEKEAWVWGFFFADGSCGFYTKGKGTGKYSWALNNQSHKYLEKAKNILNEIEPDGIEFKILDCMKSSHVDKLVPVGSLKYMVDKYRPLFYDKDKYKIVPIQILNAPNNVKYQFLKGYYAGDGAKTSGRSFGNSMRFSCKGQIGSLGLFFICKCLGYEMSVNIRPDKLDIYDIATTKSTENVVRKIFKFGKTDDFVYDLETDQGHFHAGVGSTIVKNTDSVFVDFHESSLEKAFSLAFQAAKMVTDSLPRPLELQMENFYSPLLLLTKKRYEGFIVKSNGIAIKEVSKGSINKRRDNCDAAREIYKTTLKSVMAHATQDETVYDINNQILNLYRGLVPLHNFVIYKGLKQTIEEYKNCAGHVLFAKRLEERGNVMKAGTRLEYVFLKKPGKDLKGGEIMEDWYYFLLNRHSLDLHIDYGYYLEHNIMKPVTEVLNIAYPCAEKKFYKPEEAFKLAMDAYLKPAWTKMLKPFSMEFKAKYIAKHSKKKILYEAAKNYYARVILDKLYANHGLRKRAYHRPKNGQSHIFLNDKILEQILDYHQFWYQVKMQIKERINIPVWIEIKWTRK